MATARAAPMVATLLNAPDIANFLVASVVVATEALNEEEMPIKILFSKPYLYFS